MDSDDEDRDKSIVRESQAGEMKVNLDNNDESENNLNLVSYNWNFLASVLPNEIL